MLGRGAHGVVGDTGGGGFAHPGGVGEEGVESAVAALEEGNSQWVGELDLWILWKGGAWWNFSCGGRFCYLHRLGQCKYHRSARERSSGSRLRAGWAGSSLRTCPETRGIRWL